MGSLMWVKHPPAGVVHNILYTRPTQVDVKPGNRTEVVEVWSGCYLLRCCPHHLTIAQNYEDCSKMALMLLQNGAFT
ncbi:hypothetical protein AVEN_15224-1 [Araneus ventricosus]|uniref:Uncharacterized protein n=1 Tax=Araneus ventricosus TaxID=182803 RepID=A0A4Y2RTG9_ARAVE|nr:hypothetical protein AVEN_15224-1 [Araneus ventricosus]